MERALFLLLLVMVAAPLPAQTLSVFDASGPEQQPGSSGLVGVPVSLDIPASVPVTFDYDTTSESATGGFDYESVSGSLTIPPGATLVMIPILLRGDGMPEEHETFRVNIRNIRGALPGRTTARVTILDVDPIVFIVTSSDAVDDGPCDLVHCSLREAIKSANLRAGVRDVIHFAIPGEGPHVINHAQLPLEIADPLVIDGYTQRDARPNTAAVGAFNGDIQIEIRGDDTAASPFAFQVLESAPNTVIRGLAFGRFPVAIHMDGARRSSIEGCFIGVNARGVDALPNEIGVRLDATSDVTVGGFEPSQRNVISGNRVGVHFRSGPMTRTRVENNLFGTNATGREILSNREDAIRVDPMSPLFTTVIGNVIAGSGESAIDVTAATGLAIQNNVIGASWDGTVAIPNLAGGIHLIGASRTTMAANTIAFNNGPGIWISGSQAASANRISRNAIFDNLRTGIDLSTGTTPDGPTLNDTADFDSGPNGLQNFPVLTEATNLGSFTLVRGTLTSLPNASYVIEVFSNRSCDPSGHGEGESFVAAIDVATDASGNAAFLRNIPAVPVGRLLTATATDTNGSTSEFSRCFSVQPQTRPIRRRAAGGR